jgi:hypothetical protein
LLSVLPHDRGGRFEANAYGAALVDKGALGGNAFDDILGSQNRSHPVTTLRPVPAYGRQSPVLNFYRPLPRDFSGVIPGIGHLAGGLAHAKAT